MARQAFVVLSLIIKLATTRPRVGGAMTSQLQKQANRRQATTRPRVGGAMTSQLQAPSFRSATALPNRGLTRSPADEKYKSLK